MQLPPQKQRQRSLLNIVKSTGLGLLLLGCTSSLHAELSLSAHIASIGPGLELAYTFNPAFAIRGAWQQYSTDYTFKSEDQNGIRGDELSYDGNFDLKNASLFADWYPFRGNFRLTTGFLINNSSSHLTSNCESNSTSIFSATACEIGSGTIPGDEIGELRIAIDFEESIAPYIGVGWAWQTNKSWHFNADLGVAYLGTGRADIQSSGSCNTSSSCRAQLDEEEREIEKDMESLAFFPVAKLGFGYRF